MTDIGRSIWREISVERGWDGVQVLCTHFGVWDTYVKIKINRNIRNGTKLTVGRWTGGGLGSERRPRVHSAVLGPELIALGRVRSDGFRCRIPLQRQRRYGWFLDFLQRSRGLGATERGRLGQPIAVLGLELVVLDRVVQDGYGRRRLSRTVWYDGRDNGQQNHCVRDLKPKEQLRR